MALAVSLVVSSGKTTVVIARVFILTDVASMKRRKRTRRTNYEKTLTKRAIY